MWAGLVGGALILGAVDAATRTFDWRIETVVASPDGVVRDVIGVNGVWPPPALVVDEGDRVVLRAENGLQDAPTSLHVHGLFQNGTNPMDGPVGVTQCGIPPGATMTYRFDVMQHGTYWIHSHVAGQYPDGLRAPFVVRARAERARYEAEYTVALSDWYHEAVTTILARTFLARSNPTGAEPVPAAALINDSAEPATLAFEPGKTYRLRFVNMAAFARFHVWIPGHAMRVIELDGVDVEPHLCDGVDLAAAQRVSVLVTALRNVSHNYPLVASMDATAFDNPDPELKNNATAWIVYDPALAFPDPEPVSAYFDFDDTACVPLDPLGVAHPEHNITLDFDMQTLADGINYALFNHISYREPVVPTLLTAMSAPREYLTSPGIYGHVSPFILPHKKMIQIVLNNADDGDHPFHLHGHVFQVVYRSEQGAGPYRPDASYPFADNPVRRDTVNVNGDGFVILRFRADNPGVWLFHCHIEWHILQGLVATMIEAPDKIQESLHIPDDIYDHCKAQNIPVEGNAAGHSFDTELSAFDLSGLKVQPPFLPPGFTGKGIGAMIGCILSAFLGISSIVWYGLTSPIAIVKTAQPGWSLQTDAQSPNGGPDERQRILEQSERP